VIIENCTFDQISALENGGSVFVHNMNANIMNSKFLSSSAIEGSGGAIFLSCISTSKSRQSKLLVA